MTFEHACEQVAESQLEAPLDPQQGIQEKAARAVRELLSKKRNPPIKQVIDAGMVPRLIELLTKSKLPTLHFEAAWALTNIVSGSSEHVKACVKEGIMPKMTQLLDSPNHDVREQAMWAIRLLLSQMNNSNVRNFFNEEIMRMKHHDCSEEVKVFIILFIFMTQLLDSTSDDVREQAVWAIRLLLSQMNNSDVCDFFNTEIMRMEHHDCSEEVKVCKLSASSASPRLSAVSSARIATLAQAVSSEFKYSLQVKEQLLTDVRVEVVEKELNASKAVIESIERKGKADEDAAARNAQLAELGCNATRAASGAAMVSGGDHQLDRRERDEIADLRAKLQSVTMREKERLKALQSQLEAARHELKQLVHAEQKTQKMDLNLRALLIKMGVHFAGPIISDLAPCVSESHLKELLAFCAKDKEFCAILPSIFREISHTPLDLSSLPILSHVENANLSILTLLLEKRASPNNTNDRGPCPRGQKGGLTPLHAAVSKGTDFIKILIEARADCNIPGGSMDNTPLHDACLLQDEEKSAAIVGLMLQVDSIDLFAKNKRKKTAADICKHARVKSMLLEYSEKQTASHKKPSKSVPSSPVKKVVSSPVKGGASLSLAVVDQAAADTSLQDSNRGRFQKKAVLGCARPVETSTLDQRLDAMRTLLQDGPLVLPPGDADMHSANSSQQYANFTPVSPEVNSASIAGAVSGTDPSERTQISDARAAGEVADCLPGLPHAGIAGAVSGTDPSERTQISEIPQVSAEVGERSQDLLEASAPDVLAAAGAQQCAEYAGADLVSAVRQMRVSGDSWEMRFTREFKEQVSLPLPPPPSLPPTPLSQPCFSPPSQTLT